MSECNQRRQEAGLAYPKTCPICKLGPCRQDQLLDREDTARKSDEPFRDSRTLTLHWVENGCLVNGSGFLLNGPGLTGVTMVAETPERLMQIIGDWARSRASRLPE